MTELTAKRLRFDRNTTTPNTYRDVEDEPGHLFSIIRATAEVCIGFIHLTNNLSTTIVDFDTDTVSAEEVGEVARFCGCE